MWLVFGNVVVAALIIYAGFPSLVRQKAKRELVTFILLLVMAFVLGIMISLKMNIPNPLVWTSHILQPVSQWFFSQIGIKL